MKILLHGEESEGLVAILEDAVPPAWEGPPLHHHGWDETFYVLAGELTLQLADRVETNRAGEVAFAPRGVHHTFANLSEAPASYRVVCTPAGFERYFDTDRSWAPEDLPERFAVGPSLGSRVRRDEAGA
ncbi:MAG: cupin domain-containing protein [Actinomycetota bacterium]|nr:cupin domain-containing protein [Actinomycetota bacterium]